MSARDTIAFSIIALFGVALMFNINDQMILGALIGSFTTVTGFYLGGAIKDLKAQPVTVQNTDTNPVPVETSKGSE